METYYFYSIINIRNNKKYCGITKDPHNRILKHFRELRNKCHHSVKLQNAFNKYGESSFQAKIEEKLDFENILEAYDHEKEFILKNDSYLNGYNMTAGGLGVLDSLSHQKTKESWWDRVDSIYQIDKETYQIINVFPSLREIERQLGYGHGNISKVCHRTDVSAYGYYWCFVKDWKEDWLPPINQKYNPIAIIDEKDNSIIKVFQSCAEAGRKLFLDRSNIRNSILRNGKSGGYKFRYITIEEYELYACRD